MPINALLEQYDLLDNAILRHSFTRYNRDYLIVADLHYANDPGEYHFLFHGCVEAHHECLLNKEAFSMDDEWINETAWEDLDVIDKHVWVRYAVAYPGCKRVKESERAKVWSERMNVAMHELLIEADVFTLRLIFHDVRVRRIGDCS